eukprot:gene17676-24027_t
MFKKIFGNKEGQASAPPTSQTKATVDRTINAIQGLSDKEEQLDLRKALLEKKIEAELEKAREYTKQKKKPQALQCLKKKKLLENEMRLMLESQSTTVDTVLAMKNATTVMKTNLKEADIDTVDKILDDCNDVKEQMSQINDAFGQSTGNNEEFDEELEELEAQLLDEELLAPAPVPTTRPQQAMPTAPSDEELLAPAPVPTTRPQQAMPTAPSDEELLAPAPVPTTRPQQAMPTAPSGAVAPRKKTQEELELEALEAEMAEMTAN